MDSDENYVVDSIIKGGNYALVKEFRSQPLANKISALERAVVKPRKDDTPDKVAGLVKELVKRGALTPDEAGPVYSDLLIRVHKYNGSNVQENLAVLTDDIRAAQSSAIKLLDVGSLSNQTVLNSFFSKIGASVPYGQENFEAFKQVLRLFVNEAPNVRVFISGDATILQANIRGVISINLNEAFRNLNNYWGIILEGESIPGSITSRLSSNTRVLLMILSPFTSNNTFTPDSFISYIMGMYRDTISSDYEVEENTESEVFDVARSIGADELDLKHTVGYLIKGVNESAVAPAPRQLTPRQLQVLRYVQDSLADRIDRNGEDPSDALDDIQFSFSPSYYELNGPFIRRLVHFMRAALINSPSYFREIYSNKYWTPPGSFWSKNYADFELDMFNERNRRVDRGRDAYSLEWEEETNRDDTASPVSEYRTAQGVEPYRGSSSMFTPMSNAIRNAIRDRRRDRRFRAMSYARRLDDFEEEEDEEDENPYSYLSPRM
ncbi:pIIIa protein [Amniota adenovirus 1]|nr:pIIIa protein [Amniota adenovirus 1]